MRGAAFLAALLSLPLLGYGAIPDRVRVWTNAAARIALAAAAGILVLTLEMLALSTLHIPWTVPRLVVIPLAAAALRFGKRPPAAGARASATALRPFWAALTAISLLLVSFAAMTARATAGDLLLFWGPKAQRFADVRAIDVAYLDSPAHTFMQPDYPPVLTSIWAFASLAAGRFAWGASLATLPIFLALSVLAFWGISRTRLPDSGESTALMSALFGFVLVVGLTAGNADPVLLFFETVALCLVVFAPDAPGSMLAASLALAGAVLTKIEGAFFAAAVVAAVVVVQRFRGWRRVAVVAAAPAVALAGWILWTRAQGLSLHYAPHLGTTVSLPRLVSIGRELVRSASYGVFYLPWIVALALLIRGRPGRGPRLALVAAGVLLALDAGVYLTNPADPSLWVAWSGQRVLISPLLCVFVAGVAATDGNSALDDAGPSRAVPEGSRGGRTRSEASGSQPA